MGSYDDLDEPPNIPAFCLTPRRQQQNSLSTAISGAASALMKALAETPRKDEERQTESCGVSPCKAVDLRMKNYQQLRYIQQLFDDGILSNAEYVEQKQCILTSLRKL